MALVWAWILRGSRRLCFKSIFIIANGRFYCFQAGRLMLHITLAISPPCWIGQKYRDGCVNASDPTANKLPSLQPLDVAIHPVIRNEIEHPFVERNHRFHIIIYNCLPEFSHGFGFNFPVEILFPKNLFNVFRIIGWKGIVAVEDEFEWTFVIHIEANVSKFLRVRSVLGMGSQPASCMTGQKRLSCPLIVGERNMPC